MSLFVDTSAWYAAADSGDRSNSRAVTVLSQTERLVTTDHILVETWLLLRQRIHRQAADRYWEGLRSSVATIESAADLEVAWSIGEAFPDLDFSIVDRTSFAVMQRLGIRRVATFDNDFAVYRFGRNRDCTFAYDLRVRSRGHLQPSPAVALTVIDEKSLDAEGRWLRPKPAALVDRLSREEAC